jgi:DMSO/TMAO reductase YedYZ molybdopterin-dependent catalytic subunit
VLTTLALGAGGVGSFAAMRRAELLPPGALDKWSPGEALSYASHRLLVGDAPAREFPRSEISRPPHQNGKPPKLEAFVKSQALDFRDWRLELGGMVAKPMTFTVDDIRRMPVHSQITSLSCEEGWSFVAEWAGVRLSHLLEMAGMSPQAKFVVYHSVQKNWWDSVDMADALHPQTIVAHAMNGAELTAGHGGPLRVRVPRQLGYKSVKWVTRLTVADSLASFGGGRGSFAAERGYAWYNGI